MLFLLAMPAFAQSPAAPDTLPTAEVESLLKTLKDDDRRNAFVTDLEALVAAKKLRDAEVEKSLGALVLEIVSKKMDTVGIELANMAKEIGNIPELFASMHTFFADASKRDNWLLLIGQLSLILAAGMIAE